MPKPKRKKKEESTPVKLGFSSIVGGVSPLVGEVISLNAKMGPFFMIGDINLSEKRWWATVSPEMPEEYYRVLNASLRSGYILRGKQQIHAIDKEEGVLEAWYALVNVEGKSPKSIAAFKDLIRQGQEGNHTLLEIAEYCLHNERKGKNREEAINLLKEVRTYAPTNSIYDAAVYDELDGDSPEGKDPVEIVQTSKGPRVVEIKPKPEEGSGSASKLLDNILES